MAKRFTDTNKWNKPFIRGLKGAYKILWLYLLDECDHSGIWDVDIAVAKLKTGERINEETALEQLAGKVFAFDNGTKWFIPSFIEFQYGELNPANRVHESVLANLKKYGLENIKPLTSPLQGAKYKDKEKDKEKDKPVFKIKGMAIFIKPSEWLEQHKITAIDAFMMQNGNGITKDEVYGRLDSERLQYDFKEENHVYNSFVFFKKEIELQKKAGKSGFKKENSTTATGMSDNDKYSKAPSSL